MGKFVNCMDMRKLLLLFSVLLSSALSYSQNLIYNHSFESMYSCPNGFGYIDSCVGWTSFRSSPDYFNVCGSQGLSVPNNFIGWQPTFDGNGYADIITYSTFSNEREYLGTELISPLAIGKKYFVSCYICRGNEFSRNAAVNKIGFRFFTQPFSANTPCPFDNYANVYSTTIVTDSVNWTKIEGSFIADSVYRFLAIGNFFDDQNTDTIDVYDPHYSFNNAQYYIDYVCLSEDSLINCDVTILNQPEIFNPNEFKITFDTYSKLLTITTTIQLCSLELLNIEGMVLTKENVSYSYSMDLSSFPDGLYLIKISSSQGKSWVRKIIKS